MNQEIRLRPEMDSDVNAITDVTVAAFKNLEVSDHTEQFVVTALRAAKALTPDGHPNSPAYGHLKLPHLN